ncbi:carnitine/acyl carnitine carrier [Punctularia strigosozonata HHB-11173 SS5]|uniref:carnitine/acyl carnitine carrier n=1 Tax=Punctularia strigosozonata (strain HHB-11173) TaxID=741275 RepID=UPI0004417870|nr:carnitine/acyl carnitine carrier [Punctularia strigosozonata HHB-11173 SS5]EIN06196.1 carnitine/acyl carnitine carrier [Punctularia strigosozonata HHB-11173 SS5]
MDPTTDFIAGTVAGAAGLVVGYPFDTVKVRFQNPELSSKYRSTFQSLITITREERFTGLFKGITTPLATCALLNGVVFASYRFLMKAQLSHEDDVPTLWQVGLAGAGSGIISALVTTPTELIKIHQQNHVDPAFRPNALDVARQIVRQHGVKGLYRGITSTALRDCGYGAYFAAYEATCRYFARPQRTTASPPPPPSGSRERQEQPYDASSLVSQAESEINSHSWPALLLAGALAGIASWVSTFPFDVVKTRVQASQAQGGDLYRGKYRNTWSTIVHSYRDDGPRIFFRGIAPTLIRAIPVNMVTFATFEGVVRALS